MSVCVLVQTCDLYRQYWRGFWRMMEKQWDFDIEAPIYFCSEEINEGVPDWCSSLLTGRGTFVENLKTALDLIEEDEVFLMLEDFWPISPMRRKMFVALLEEFRNSGVDTLQVSNYSPHYKIKQSERLVLGQRLLEFEPDSEWLFNFQARFWRKSVLKDCLVEPEIPERAVGSAITVEMACDEKARKESKIRASLFHYLWYPMSGVAYRGNMTEFGKHLQNVVDVDDYVSRAFNLQPSS